MTDAKPMPTLMSFSSSLSQFDSDAFQNPTSYKSTVDALQYMLRTCPDLSFAVKRVCQYIHRPTVNHWFTVKRIFRYLKTTSSYSLLITKNTSTTLQAFSDSDWTNCPDDHYSTSGYLVYFGNNLIS